MKKRFISTALALCLCVSAIPNAYAIQEDSQPQDNLSAEESTDGPVLHDEGIPAYQEVYRAMAALKDDDRYKEGTTWTNEEPYSDSKGYYQWNGGPIGGVDIVAAGCVAFAFLLSDAAFGRLPARMYSANEFVFSDVKVGDILRMNTDTHTVIVLEVSDTGVVIAEGNASGKVHWGRAISKEVLERDVSHYITRYPEGYIPPDDPTAGEVIASGTEEGLSWALTRAGVLTISGSGAIPNYSSAGEQPWSGSAGSIRKIVIEDGITGIGSCAFWQTRVLSAEIPGSVAKIGDSAFRESSLISVTIPGSVKTIGDSAFRACQNLASAAVPEGVEEIGQSAFRSCTSLASIDLPASIGEIGTAAFWQCTEMTDAVFAPGSKQVKLGDNLFTQCYRLMRVILPKSIDRIGEGMFQNDSMLAGVEIPQGAVSIGGSAFASSGVSAVIIPDSVTSIGIAAFSACPLTDIYFTGTEAQWSRVQKIGDTASAVSKAAMHYIHTPDHTHSWAEEWSSDETYHWHECTASGCPVTDNSQKDEYAAHTYDDNVDTACSTCGFVRTTSSGDSDPAPGHTHSWAEEWSSDGIHHWRECTAPGCTVTSNSRKDGYAAHVYTDSRDTACNVCGCIRTINSDSSSEDDSSSDSVSSDTSTIVITRNSDGSLTTKTEDKTTGTTTETTKRKDGAIASITASVTGQTAAEVTLPAAIVNAAQRKGEAVALPLRKVRAAQNTTNALAVTVKTGSTERVKVEIPAENVTPSTVAVIVNADGSEEVIKAAVPTKSGIAVSLSDGATVKIVDNSKHFTDVSAAHWASEAIDFVSAHEIFSGTAEAAFAPEAPMTRAMLMTVLACYNGEDTSGGAVWYEKGLEWAVANAISDGSNPNGSITREQLVSMLWRYSGSPAASSTPLTFLDAGEISGYAQQAMCWAVEKGIISGYGNGQLNPNGQVTRAEAALIMMRYSTIAL